MLKIICKCRAVKLRRIQAILVIIAHFDFRALLVSFEYRRTDKGYRQNFQGMLQILYFLFRSTFNDLAQLLGVYQEFQYSPGFDSWLNFLLLLLLLLFSFVLFVCLFFSNIDVLHTDNDLFEFHPVSSGEVRKVIMALPSNKTSRRLLSNKGLS